MPTLESSSVVPAQSFQMDRLYFLWSASPSHVPQLCASWRGPPYSEQFVNTLKLFKMHTMCVQNVFIYQISSQIRHYSK